MTLLSLLIVDDHEAILFGLQKLLEGSPRLRPVAFAKNAPAARQAVDRHDPDLICLDLILPEGDDFTLLRDLNERSRARIVVYTSVEDPAVARGALENGALASVSKGEGLKALISARSRAGAGRGYLSPCYRSGDAGASLSPRQKEILTLIVEGKSNRVIAGDLGISPDTVKTHVAAILRALDVDDRTEAAVLAVRRRLI